MPSGESNAATAFAATFLLVQNSGGRMGEERFRGRDSGRKRTTQTVGRRFGSGSELGGSNGIGNQLLHQPGQFFGGMHQAVSLRRQQQREYLFEIVRMRTGH